METLWWNNTTEQWIKYRAYVQPNISNSHSHFCSFNFLRSQSRLTRTWLAHASFTIFILAPARSLPFSILLYPSHLIQENSTGYFDETHLERDRVLVINTQSNFQLYALMNIPETIAEHLNKIWYEMILYFPMIYLQEANVKWYYVYLLGWNADILNI